MKKLNSALSVIIITGVILMMQGCTVDQFDEYISSNELDEAIKYDVIDEAGSAEEISENIDSQMIIADSENDKEQALLEEQPKELETMAVMNNEEIYYAYNNLDNSKKKIYLEIYNALNKMESDVKLSTLDKNVIDHVFSCVMNDHPELFYIDGYKYTRYEVNGDLESISFGGRYTMSPEEVTAVQSKLDEIVQQCLKDVPLNEDEYNTIKYFYDYIILNTEYNYESENNQNICSVFLYGESVCQGYAKALQYLLQKVGLQAFLVTGFTNGESHAWNLVKINEEYYYVDPTWGDVSYYSDYLNSENNTHTPEISYDYFMVTEHDITKTHTFEKAVSLPVCDSINDNYFVREGLYVECYSDEVMKQIFSQSLAEGRDNVTIKAADINVYNELVDKLIDKQKIFSFIDNVENTISYNVNEGQNTITFWSLSTST